MDKITVVCHKDHVVGYEDYRDQCLLCVVEDLMREIGRLTHEAKREYVTEVVAVHENGTYTTKRTPIQKREWVGLTDKDLEPMCDDWRIVFGPYVHDFSKAIEAKLKEKNA